MSSLRKRNQQLAADPKQLCPEGTAPLSESPYGGREAHSVSPNAAFAGRIVVYFFFDPEGIVDDYVAEALSAMLRHSSIVLFVSNGTLTEKSRKILANLGVEVLERENKGMDVMAYRHALDQLGWKRVRNAPELVLMNYTIVGPIESFEPMFSEMEQRDLDFWGISVHNGAEFDPWGLTGAGKLPLHLQSHFIAIRSRMLKSKEFRSYWRELPEITTYEQSVSWHEVKFTEHFEKLGFSWGSYVDTGDLVGKCFYPLFNYPVEMIRDRKSPIYKRKLLIAGVESFIQENDSRPAQELLGYLEETRPQHVQAIMRHIARTASPEAITKTLGLIDIIHDEDLEDKPTHFDGSTTKRVVYPMLVCYSDEAALTHISEVLLSQLPSNLEPIIVKSRSISERDGRFQQFDADSALEAAMSQLHRSGSTTALVVDLRGHSLSTPVTNFIAMLTSIRRDLFQSEGYIRRINARFRQRPWLGVLSTLPAIHGPYWEANWGLTTSQDVLTSIRDGAYWCRSQLLPSRWLPEPSSIPTIAKGQLMVTGLAMNKASVSRIVVNQAHFLEGKTLSAKVAVSEAQKRASNLEEKFGTFRVYFDLGHGYFEGVGQADQLVGADGRFHASFTVPEGVTRIRLDPNEGSLCVLSEVVASPTELDVEPLNGLRMGDQWIFLTRDPQIEIVGSFTTGERISVSFRRLAFAPLVGENVVEASLLLEQLGLRLRDRQTLSQRFRRLVVSAKRGWNRIQYRIQS